MSDTSSKSDVLKPNVKPGTLLRMQEHLERPITHGFDSALNECLDDLEKFKKNEKPQVMSCDRMEELTNG
ncbi:MAG: hypothetical protein WD033_06165 [Nitrosopumilaceae archaeon]